MFYLENDLEHICYIHESMVDDPVVKTALTIRKHLDRYWYSLPTYCGEKGYCTLKIAPLYVASGDYLEDDVSFLALPDNNWTAAASWKLLPDNQIELQFTTGETEILEIAEDMPEITIKTLNRTFYSSVGEARLNPDIASQIVFSEKLVESDTRSFTQFFPKIADSPKGTEHSVSVFWKYPNATS